MDWTPESTYVIRHDPPVGSLIPLPTLPSGITYGCTHVPLERTTIHIHPGNNPTGERPNGGLLSRRL